MKFNKNIIQKGFSLLLFFVSFSAIAQTNTIPADRPLKILFIGNSFLYNNNLPDLVNSMAEAAHIKVKIDSRIALGQSVNFHCHDKNCWAKINAMQWDYVVIQDNQRYYYDAKGLIDSFDYKNLKVMQTPLLSNNIKFQDSIKKLIPGVKIIYFAGWEKSGGDKVRFPFDSTPKLIRRLLANVKYLNDQPGVHNVIAPIGVAFLKAMQQRPVMELIPKPDDTAKYLFDHDGRHPGNGGTYLAACVLFATIFHQSPVGVTNTDKDVKPELDTFIKKVAWEAVMDSFKYTNLASVTPEIKKSKKNENLLYTSKKYVTYQWFVDCNPVHGATTYQYIPGPDVHGLECWVETLDKKGSFYKSFPVMIK